MAMLMKTGMRLCSAVCATEVIVIRAKAPELDLRCGGAPMLPEGAPEGTVSGPAAGFTEPTLLGKRYSDADETVELLCTRAGASTLSLGDVPLAVKDPRPLPASD
ncbi:MAG TPA: hypothetical protein VHX38_38360 [Pseudonocardiaceae bacterium]|jgi:hypothetical protein|nr:hypothetical protein [Pseudonocardiaceae bacterium]